MGYKLLGFIVWQGLKLYLRRRTPDATGKLAAGGLALATMLFAGLFVARRQQSSS